MAARRRDDSSGAVILLGGLAISGALAALLARTAHATTNAALPAPHNAGEGHPPAVASPPLAAPPAVPSSGPPSGIGRPLGGAPRKVTPHGGWHAPRWVVSGQTTGINPGHGSAIDHYHQGLDIAAQPGESVLAVGDGKLVAFTPGYCGQGARLVLDGFADAAVQYCDLGFVLVSPGDRVRRGDPIGLVGPRGFVHIAVSLSGHHVEPSTFLPL